MKITIITSFFNDIENFARTYNSIKLLKDNFNLEYILIDGGSKKDVLVLLNDYMDIVDKFITENDQGVYDGINKGMRLATGDYIGICNSGDEIDLQGFKKYYALLSTSNFIDVITGRVIIYNTKSMNRHVFNSRLNNLFFGLNYPHMSLYFRRDLISRIGFYDLNFKLSADYDYAKRLESASLSKVSTNIIIGTFYTGGRSGGIQTYTENFIINLKHKRSLLESALVYSLCLVNYSIRKLYFNLKL